MGIACGSWTHGLPCTDQGSRGGRRVSSGGKVWGLRAAVRSSNQKEDQPWVGTKVEARMKSRDEGERKSTGGEGFAIERP